MNSTKNNLLSQIELKKSQLNDTVKEFGLNSDVTLKVSQEIDELLSLYYIGQ